MIAQNFHQSFIFNISINLEILGIRRLVKVKSLILVSTILFSKSLLGFPFFLNFPLSVDSEPIVGSLLGEVDQ